MPPETQTQPVTDPDAGDGAQPDALDALDAALGDDPTQESDGGEPQEWTPPTREEWEAAQAALEAERGKLKRARQQAQRLRQGKAQPADGAEGAPTAPDPQTEVWRDRAVRQAAKAQLLERGADPGMVDLALGRLKAAEVDFEDDEPLLDDWLDEMEERYPKLFAKPTTAPPAGPPVPGRVNQGGATARPQPKPLSLGEQIIANSERARVNASNPRSRRG